MGLLAGAQLLIAGDASLLTIALPSIERSLRPSALEDHWLITAYLLSFAATMLAGGRIGDAYGHRRVLSGGLVVFSLTGLAASLSVSTDMLIVARALQGFGAALVGPSALALLTTVIPEGRQRYRALAFNGAALASGFPAGILAGGALVSLIGWRWLLVPSVPIAAAMSVGARRLPGRASTARAPLNLRGTVSLATAAVAATYAITDARSLATVSLAALVMSCSALFAARSQAHSLDPLIPPVLLGDRRLLRASVAMVCASGATSGIMLLLAVYLQQTLGYPPVSTAAVLLPAALGGLLIPWLGPPLILRFGLAATMSLGLGIEAAGACLLGALLTRAPDLAVLLGTALVGLGAVIVWVAASARVGTSVALEDRGLASALLSASAEFGSALGVAALLTIAGHVRGTAEPASSDTRLALFVASAVLAGAIVGAVRPSSECGAGAEEWM